MSRNKKLYNEDLFVELDYVEDMKIVGGENIYKAIFTVVDKICVSIKKKLFD